MCAESKGQRFCISLAAAAAAGMSANHSLSSVHCGWQRASVAKLIPQLRLHSQVNNTLFSRKFHFSGACWRGALISIRMDISSARQSDKNGRTMKHSELSHGLHAKSQTRQWVCHHLEWGGEDGLCWERIILRTASPPAPRTACHGFKG